MPADTPPSLGARSAQTASGRRDDLSAFSPKSHSEADIDTPQIIERISVFAMTPCVPAVTDLPFHKQDIMGLDVMDAQTAKIYSARRAAAMELGAAPPAPMLMNCSRAAGAALAGHAIDAHVNEIIVNEVIDGVQLDAGPSCVNLNMFQAARQRAYAAAEGISAAAILATYVAGYLEPTGTARFVAQSAERLCARCFGWAL